MKKVILSLITLSFFTTTFTQEAFDKKYQFGIVLGTGFNMNKTSSLMNREGIGTDQTLGFNFNYNINSTLTLTSGLEFDFEAYKYKPKDSLVYYFTENKIVQKEDLDVDNLAANQDLYLLSQRQYRTTYLILPVFATLKTKAFGNMQYFGKFGTRIGIKSGGRINDKGFTFAGDSLKGKATSSSNDNMVLRDDVHLFKINAGIAGGLMWNFSGSTMLMGEIGYYFGLTQIHYGEKSLGDDPKRNYTLIDISKENTLSERKYSAPAAKQGQILIKLTLFF